MRLIDTEVKRPKKPYATVSHVWGSDPFIMLNAENLREFESGVPLKGFPLTFQHLMITAWRLELQYLWIDCYCILQDNAEDKIQEVSTMDQVYSNTLLNLGATAASNPTADALLNAYLLLRRVCLYRLSLTAIRNSTVSPQNKLGGNIFTFMTNMTYFGVPGYVVVDII